MSEPSADLDTSGTPVSPRVRRSTDTETPESVYPLELIQARLALAEVLDPELGIDVVSLGLVYDMRLDGNLVEIDMTLTTPGCPVSEQLPLEAEEAVRRALPDHEVLLQIVWDPPWTPERMSEDALDALGFRRR